MKKRISVWLAALATAAVVCGLGISVGAESLYIRKIVSVVYDDSGSMNADNKWACANYAMQAFAGMLNGEDRLYITYMSDACKGNFEPVEMDLSAGRIQSSVDAVRSHSNSDGTPYTAVTAAYETLAAVEDDNPNTQYWLVIITDGAFQECLQMTDEEKARFLQEEFGRITDAVMPNGTHPQITYLGICMDEKTFPAADPDGGIHTYAAQSADNITDAMSDMADRISGRTRLQKKDLHQVDERTIRVSSTIPLLNIAVFAQASDAQLTGAVQGGEAAIPISRQAALSYPGYPALTGGAWLLGDSVQVIGAGSYEIAFDKPVSLEDVVVLFEPALEMRMTLTVNGREITDRGELEQVFEGDTVSVSCRIYEMGTDKEVSPDLLPPGTRFAVTVREGGTVVHESDGDDMLLDGYVLQPTETEIAASAVIEGFRPITYRETFTPAPIGSKIRYTLAADNPQGSRVKLSELTAGTDFAVVFTVLADGVPLTDKAAVQALNPVLEASPAGNGGAVTYTDEGKIIFTPVAAAAPAGEEESVSVTVTCTLDNGVTGIGGYTVLLADFQVHARDAAEPVRKTAFYENRVGVTFTVTKDGVQLDKAGVEKQMEAALNEAHEALQLQLTVAEDGTISVIPSDAAPYALTFGTWWTNWYRYFRLPGEDVRITLHHTYGDGEAVIPVMEETLRYQLLAVYLPLALELTALILLVTWIWLVVTKPRYSPNAVLYVGSLMYSQESGKHIISRFHRVELAEFNKCKRGYGRLKFKREADEVNAGGIMVQADRGSRIFCEKHVTWYRSMIQPANTDYVALHSPRDIAEYIRQTPPHQLLIDEFATTETVSPQQDKSLAPAMNPAIAKYIVVPNQTGGIARIGERNVIRRGKIFIYVNE